MHDINSQLLELILPSGILNHFVITDFKQESSGQAAYTVNNMDNWAHKTITLSELFGC